MQQAWHRIRVEFIYDHYKIDDKVVILYDDVKRISEIIDGAWQELDSFDGVCREAFTCMTRSSLHIAGLRPSKFKSHEVCTEPSLFSLHLVYDPVHFIINKRRYRSPQFMLKTDYENSVINFKADGGVVRLNKYTMDVVYNHRNDVGNKAVAEKLARKYKDYLYASGTDLRVRARHLLDRPSKRPRLS